MKILSKNRHHAPLNHDGKQHDFSEPESAVGLVCKQRLESRQQIASHSGQSLQQRRRWGGQRHVNNSLLRKGPIKSIFCRAR
jgi:hypothetical protein